MSAEAGNQRDLERWIGWIRLGAILFAIFQVSLTSGYPAGYHSAAWATTACFAAGSLLLFLLSRREWSRTEQVRLGFAALTELAHALGDGLRRRAQARLVAAPPAGQAAALAASTGPAAAAAAEIGRAVEALLDEAAQLRA